MERHLDQMGAIAITIAMMAVIDQSNYASYE